MTTLVRSLIKKDSKTGESFRFYLVMAPKWRDVYRIARSLNLEGFEPYYLAQRGFVRTKHGPIAAAWKLPIRPLLNRLFYRSFRQIIKGMKDDSSRQLSLKQTDTTQRKGFISKLEGVELRNVAYRQQRWEWMRKHRKSIKTIR